MKNFTVLALSALLSLFHPKALYASSSLPMGLAERVGDAKAIFRGTVLENASYRDPADGGIYTRTLLRVDESLKGTFPQNIKLVHRGGVFDGEAEINGFAPRFNVNEERLVFLEARQDGTLFAYRGRSERDPAASAGEGKCLFPIRGGDAGGGSPYRIRC